MALAYRPPGINIEELASPSINSVLAVTSAIGIVGLSRGYTSQTVQVNIGPNPGVGTNSVELDGGIAAADTTILVTDADNATTPTAPFPASGALIIGTEVVTYTGKSDTTFTGVTRGAYGTTAATHADAVPVRAVTVIEAPAGSTIQAISGSQTFEKIIDTLSPTAGSSTDQSGYVEGTDFDATLLDGGAAVAIEALVSGGSPLESDGSSVRVTYRYLPDNYFEAIRLDSQAAVEARFGEAYAADSVGNAVGIGSRVSYAANLAFENGAAEVIIQPLFKDDNGTRVQPTDAEAAAVANWEATLDSIRDIEDINLLVPVVGQGDPQVGNTAQLSILQAVQDHIAFMKTQGQYVIAVIAEDGTDAGSDTVDAARLRADAELLRDRHGGELSENLVFVSPGRFSKSLPTLSTDLVIGGQYAAAAVAGMIASRPIYSPITRKQLSGIKAVLDPRTRAEKDADAQAGLLVVEQKGLAVQVRHGITLDDSSTAKRELSVVRAKHRMIESLRATFDNNLPIVADGNAEVIIKSICIGVLEDLRASRELVSYSNVQSRILIGDPTTGEVRFSYRPAYPLNNVNIVFSIDLNTGTITPTTL